MIRTARMLCMALGTAAALLTSFGCASSRSGDELARPTAPADWPSDPRAQPAFSGVSGLPMTWDSVVAAASAADVVLIGETHGHPMGLSTAAALWEDIVARRPNTAALSMEFFERDHQAALDDYLLGITPEDAFMKATQRSEGNYPPGHRAMIETARAHGRPVYAANSPRRYTRLARTEGFDRLRALTPEQQRLFTIPESLTSGGYRSRFFELMGGAANDPAHGPAGGDAPAAGAAQPTPEEIEARRREAEAVTESFFRSQNVWDATMAETIALALDRGGAPVVHVVGQFHSDFEGGLTERIKTLRPRAKVMTVSVQPVWSRELRSEDAGGAAEDGSAGAGVPRADVVIYVGEHP